MHCGKKWSLSVRPLVADASSEAFWVLTSNTPIRNRYAANSAKELDLDWSNVKIPHAISSVGTSLCMGTRGKRNINGIWPITAPAAYIVCS